MRTINWKKCKCLRDPLKTNAAVSEIESPEIIILDNLAPWNNFVRALETKSSQWRISTFSNLFPKQLLRWYSVSSFSVRVRKSGASVNLYFWRLFLWNKKYIAHRSWFGIIPYPIFSHSPNHANRRLRHESQVKKFRISKDHEGNCYRPRWVALKIKL